METDTDWDENITSDSEWETVEEYEEEIEDAVSMFLVHSSVRSSVTFSSMLHFLRNSDDIYCGSGAEFYIDTVHSCVDDIDIMMSVDTVLAFTEDIPVIPDDVRSLNEIILCCCTEFYRSHPGFVRLRLLGEMKFNWVLKKYEFFKEEETDDARFFSFKSDQQMLTDKLLGSWLNTQVKGPALKSVNELHNCVYDSVFTVHCIQWPTEVSDWASRPRHSGWPTEVSIQDIVQNGCHIVHAQHRDCQDDEFQCRFSFSVAEVILLRSWTKAQQIVYHVVRFFAKKELIQKDCPKEKEVLCTYHLKTLMLWTCEQESSEWWNSFPVIAICCKLLLKLSQWIEKKHCPNYFIPKANLFNQKIHPDSCKVIIDRLDYFCDSFNLSQWFAINYILPHYNEVTDSTANMISLSDIRRLAKRFIDLSELLLKELLDDDFSLAYSSCIEFVNLESFESIFQPEIKPIGRAKNSISLTAQRMFATSEKQLIYFETSLFMLSASNALSWRRTPDDINFIAFVLRLVSLASIPNWRSTSPNLPKNYEERLDIYYACFLRAQEQLETLTGSESNAQFRLSSRVSVELLRKSFPAKDSASGTIRSAVVVYLASICYATSQYQTAIDLCCAMFSNQSQGSSECKEPLNAGCLIFIDDISNIIGFLLIFRRIQDRTLHNHRRFNLDLSLTPAVVAQYLVLQSMIKTAQKLRVNFNAASEVFLLDVILMTITQRKFSCVARETNKLDLLCGSEICVYRRSDSINDLINCVEGFDCNEDIVVQLLLECSLQKMACFYEVVLKDFGINCKSVVCCYNALFMYKCGKREDALNLCELILQESEHVTEFGFANVLALPAFGAFFDDDVQCLIGFQMLFHVFHPTTAPVSGEIYARILEIDSRATKTHLATFLYTIRNETLIPWYSLRSHFVARYLTLRYCIDCKSSISEITRIFDKLKWDLPFEFIICLFFRRKLKA